MKKLVTLLCCVVLAASAASASAAGVNLAWSRCYGECSGTVNRTFACNTNVGSHVAVGSFVAPPGVTALSGNEVVIDLQSSSATLPAWWGLRGTGQCRGTGTPALSVNFLANASDGVCVDEFAGGAAGGIGAYTVGYAGNPARARLTMAIATASPGPVDADVEYFAFNMVINNTRTVGTGACAGCLTPVSMVLNSILLTQPFGVGNFMLSQGNAPSSSYITWQGGRVYESGCLADTPTKNSTWGSVKSLYR